MNTRLGEMLYSAMAAAMVAADAAETAATAAATAADAAHRAAAVLADAETARNAAAEHPAAAVSVGEHYAAALLSATADRRRAVGDIRRAAESLIYDLDDDRQGRGRSRNSSGVCYHARAARLAAEILDFLNAGGGAS